jgi:integrase
MLSNESALRRRTGQGLAKQADVFALPLPAGKKEALYFDKGKLSERVPGLALRIREGGSRRFIFFFRLAGKSQRVTIGDASAWSLDAARARARELRVKVDRGEHPAADRQAAKVEQARQVLTLGAVAADYLDDRRSKMRPRTHSETTRYLRDYFKPLHDLQIDKIERRDVAAQCRTIAKENGPVAADRARSVLSALYAWAIGEGKAEANPVIGTNKCSDNSPRNRVLSDAELAKIWNALSNNDYGAIVRLLILTGCRREEIGGLRWSEVNLDAKTITIPGSRTKNYNQHVVPLSDLALDTLQVEHRIIGRDLVFGRSDSGFLGFTWSKRLLDQAVPLEPPWVIHDIRRTVRTGLGKLGVAPHIAEAVLNHLPPRLTRTYDTYKYEPEKRDALDRWANHIKLILAKASGANIVEMTRA